MQALQLYINDVRVDLFDDESVVLTQTIQNVRQFDKVFTDFSKTFNLPASKTNNKLFKHYYNFDIINGFDARKKVNARIELNNTPFRIGKIKLEGVDLIDNKANLYKVTFFGNTVTLKELFGEDKLNSLTSLTSFNKEYSASNIVSDLQLDSTTNDFIVPLISNSRRYYYDSATTDLIDFSSGDASPKGGGNLYYVFDRYQGVYYKDLKYALRVYKIIEAIEVKYNITFSNDFFNSSNTPYYQLFLWLHRKKGYVESLDNTISSIVDGWTGILPPNPPNDTLTYMSSNSVLKVEGNPQNYTAYSLELQTASVNKYRALIFRNGELVFRSAEVTGNLIIDENDFTIQQGEYTVYIEGVLNINYSSIRWDIEYEAVNIDTYINSSYTYNAIFVFDIPQQVPEIKVIDFVSGLFKMFNLTAYIENDEIVVQTLDNYYAGGNSYDITKYVEVDKNSVDVALPYREISFVYSGLESFLAKDHEQRFAKKWGQINYTDGEVLDGDTYKVELPFSQMKYERLLNVVTGLKTQIMYGWMVDDSEDAIVDKPLLFYPVTNSGTPISFVSDSTTNTSLTTYNVPSNSLELSSGGSLDNINFFNEINEYTSSNLFSDTLFEVYYKSYMQSIFNSKNRLTKVTAYLPLNIMLNYKLSDRFIIKGNKYKINSIKTNLITGKSEMELLNDI